MGIALRNLLEFLILANRADGQCFIVAFKGDDIAAVCTPIVSRTGFFTCFVFHSSLLLRRVAVLLVVILAFEFGSSRSFDELLPRI